MKAVLIAMAALAFATVPFFAPFDGFDPDLFPVPQNDPPIQPAGYAFAIWGLIYIWLVVSAVFGLVARANSAEWDETRWPLMGSLTIGAAWLPAAQISAVWATVMIWAMWGLALMAFLRSPSSDRWLLRSPVALFTGWLTAASWVSIGLLGAGFGFGPGAFGWALIGLAGALITAGLVQRARVGEPIYTAALVWALVGVAVANSGGSGSIIAIALGGAVLLGAQAAIHLRA